ncbi:MULTISPECIES: hypothetical protein [unclassified Nonomuraea]|uniref:DUF7158 domain-containing protein n=1 Tax=unclassified Nonomuraea TaxID=2593643 RepID=UPI00340555F4
MTHTPRTNHPPPAPTPETDRPTSAQPPQTDHPITAHAAHAGRPHFAHAPVTGEPGTGEPGTGEPDAGEPGAGEPGAGELVAPGVGPVLGWLDGCPLPRSELDRRLAALRAGPRSAALPAPGTAEDRQLTRWVAQVVLTEHLCAAEATARGLPLEKPPSPRPDQPTTDAIAARPGQATDAIAVRPGRRATDAIAVRLDQRAAVELGSIAAAAYEGSAAVRAVYEAVTADVTVSAAEAAAYREATARPTTGPTWRLRTPDGEFDAEPGSLPVALAEALAAAVPGRTVTAGPWTATLVACHNPTPGTASTAPADGLLDSARRVAFVRWLDHARAHRLRLVPGLEHPGDPAQPDNHHRH